MTVGERIKQRRLELNLTQSELAERMGYKSKVAISNVENGKEDLTTTRVRKYAEALECTPAYLHGWESLDGKPKESSFDKYLGEISKGEHPATAEIIQITQQLDGYLVDKLLDKAHKLLDAQKNIND